MNDAQFILKVTRAYEDNIDKGIKYCEIAIQEIIEKMYNCTWWKVCTLSIFNEVLEFSDKGQDSIFLADKLLKNIKENL